MCLKVCYKIFCILRSPMHSFTNEKSFFHCILLGAVLKSWVLKLSLNGILRNLFFCAQIPTALVSSINLLIYKYIWINISAIKEIILHSLHSSQLGTPGPSCFSSPKQFHLPSIRLVSSSAIMSWPKWVLAVCGAKTCINSATVQVKHWKQTKKICDGWVGEEAARKINFELILKGMPRWPRHTSN